jgi:hypothetical protein
VNGALAIEDISDRGLLVVAGRLNDHMSQRKEPVHMSLDGSLRDRRVFAQPHLYLTKHADDGLLALPDSRYTDENRVQDQLAVKGVNEEPVRVGSVGCTGSPGYPHRPDGVARWRREDVRPVIPFLRRRRRQSNQVERASV